MPQQLNSQQRKYLLGLAHRLKPVIQVGKSGLTPDVVAAVDAALAKHELIKIKFLEVKEKESKGRMTAAICDAVRCAQAGAIGHTAILYRPAAKPSRRKIVLPQDT